MYTFRHFYAKILHEFNEKKIERGLLWYMVFKEAAIYKTQAHGS